MHYFDMVAYADNPNWSRCFCMERLVDDYPSRTKEQNRASRSELLRSAKANGRVISLHVRTGKHGMPTPVAEVVGRVGGGLDGDVHAHRTSRAVLVVDRATLDALGLAPGDLREEITIEGLPDVTNLPIDSDLRIGGGCPPSNGPSGPRPPFCAIPLVPDSSGVSA